MQKFIFGILVFSAMHLLSIPCYSASGPQLTESEIVNALSDTLKAAGNDVPPQLIKVENIISRTSYRETKSQVRFSYLSTKDLDPLLNLTGGRMVKTGSAIISSRIDSFTSIRKIDVYRPLTIGSRAVQPADMCDWYFRALDFSKSH